MITEEIVSTDEETGQPILILRATDKYSEAIARLLADLYLIGGVKGLDRNLKFKAVADEMRDWKLIDDLSRVT